MARRHFIPAKGMGATSKIIAQEDSVNLKFLDGTYLLKKGDFKDYPFDVLKAARTSTARSKLNVLLQQGKIKIVIVPIKGSARDRLAKQHRADLRRQREKRDGQPVPEPEHASSKPESKPTSSVSVEKKPEQESPTSVPETQGTSSSSEMVEQEISSSTSVWEESSSSSESEKVREDEDTAALQQRLVDELVAIHGVSKRMATQIIDDLERWDRQSIENVKFMRTENVSHVLEILGPHRQTFGK